jgi:hypothetical protein
MSKIQKLLEIQSEISEQAQDYICESNSNGCGCGGGATNCNGNF